jgi:hypothetical protein
MSGCVKAAWMIKPTLVRVSSNQTEPNMNKATAAMKAR